MWMWNGSVVLLDVTTVSCNSQWRRMLQSQQMTSWRVQVMTRVITTAHASQSTTRRRHQYVIAASVHRNGQVTGARCDVTHLLITAVWMRQLLTLVPSMSPAQERRASTASVLQIITSHPHLAASVYQVSLLHYWDAQTWRFRQFFALIFDYLKDVYSTINCNLRTWKC